MERIKRMISSGIVRAIAALIFMVGASQHVYAIEASGSVGTSVEHTDNVRRTNTNADTDVVQTTYVALGVEEVRKRFKADANVNVQNDHYYERSYEDETSVTSGFGLFTIDLVEDFLEWQATFSRTDVVADSSQDENPDTLEYRNIFRTGPTITYAFSRTTNISLRGTFIQVENSGDSADDNQRAEGSASLNHTINSVTSVSLSGSHSEIIESESDEDITNDTYSIGFSRSFSGGELNMSLGQQEVSSKKALTDESEVGTFADILITRRAVLGHDLALKYNHSISDTSLGFEDDEVGNRLDIDPVQATTTTDIETRSRLNFSAVRDTELFLYDLGLIYEESEFKLQDFTERYRGATLGFSPKLYPRLRPRIQYTYGRESFGLVKGLGVDTTHGLTASISYQFVDSLFATASTGYETRSNNIDPSRKFDEFTFGVGIRWVFL